MPRLMANTRFERYRRGDLIAPQQEQRFRGTYAYAVVEATDEDLAELERAEHLGMVGAWVERMCARPSVAEVAAEAAKPAPVQEPTPAPAPERVVTVVPKQRGGKRGGKRGAQKAEAHAEPEPQTVDEPADEDGED